MSDYGIHCNDCPLKDQSEPFDGKGPDDARFMVVTGAPSHNPSHYGRLLQPLAMKTFSKCMGDEQFGPEDFFLYPGIRCPHDPDKFTTKEKTAAAKACRNYYEEELAARNPLVVIPLGAEAAKQVFGRAVKITKVRGVADVLEGTTTTVLPMLNPMQVALYPQHEATFRSDCATLGRLVDHAYDSDAAAQASLGNYTYVDDLQFLIDQNPDLIALDSENTGLRWFASDAQILTLQFCIKEGEAFMLAWDHPDKPRTDRWKAKIKKQLRQLLCREGVTVVGQNLKYDVGYLYAQTGIRVRIGGDTLMLATLLDENAMTKNLDDLTKRYVPDMAGYADRFNLEVDKSKMIELPLDNKFLDYGCGDADATFRLYKTLYAEVAEDEKLLAHYEQVSLPGLNALGAIEARGLYVDEEYVEEFEKFMEGEVNRQYESLMKQVPRSIKRKHIEKGLKFSRKDFVLDILFYHPDGFRLTPKVFTKTTAKLDDDRKVPSTSSKDHLPYFFDDCPFTFELANYVKSERILGTNVRGFKAKYIVDGMVRPTYSLHRTVTGRTACLTGDTPIYVLDARGEVPIRDIKAGDWVWSFNDALAPVPAQVSWAGKTLKAASLVEVTVLTQGRRGTRTIRCTPDHPFRLRDGSYVRADALTAGMRTMALERGINHNGYRRVYATGQADFLEHIRVAECTTSTSASGMHVHHKDEVKLSNVPSNLRILTPEAHVAEHPWVQSRIAKREATRAAKCIFTERKDKGTSRLMFDRRWAEHVLHQAKGRPTVFRDEYGFDYTAAMKALKKLGVDWKAIRRAYTGAGRRITDAMIAEAKKCTRVHDAARVLGVNFYKAKEILAADNNHMVLSVRRLRQREDVYDLTIPGTHNFIANGVCVHNSEDPNGQNFPKRGPIAKAYRKLFVAPQGYFLLEADLSQAELRIAGDMANDPTMIKIYREAGDIHTYTALIVMQISMEEFLELPKQEQKDARTKAKAVNFGFLYGMGWKKFVAYAKTQYGAIFTEKEAKRVRTDFFERYFRLPEWHKKMREFAFENGFVRSYSGRIRHLPMIWSEDEGIQAEAQRQAINSPVQEFGSSLGVMACGRIHEEVDERYLSLVGFVHDALYAYVPKRYIEWGAKTLCHYMETNDLEAAFGRKMKLPIVADASIGINLGETYELGEFDRCDEYGECDVGTYDFGQFWDTEKNSGIIVPRQFVPPNNGRLVTSIYG